MNRTCDDCGRLLRGRPDKRFCDEKCSKRFRRRAAASVSELPTRVDDTPDAPAGLVASYEAELREAGRLDTALGQQVLVLARMLLGASGSGAAALSKDLRAARAEALRGARVETSRVNEHKDELAARRARGA